MCTHCTDDSLFSLANKSHSVYISVHNEVYFTCIINRATSVLLLEIEQKEPGRSDIGLSSCLTLVDLAGVESNTCDHLIQCIHALSEKKSHVPYRDSKLSRVLQVCILTRFVFW